MCMKLKFCIKQMNEKSLITTTILISIACVLYMTFVFLGFQRGLHEGKITLGNELDVRNEFIPIGWAYKIWYLIFVWLGVSLVHVITCIFRSNHLFVYKFPIIFSKQVAIFFILNLTFSIIWILTWDHVSSRISTVLHTFMVISSMTTLYFLASEVWKNIAYLSTYSIIDLWAYRLLILNSYTLFTTWTFLTLIFNMGMTFIMENLMSGKVASAFCIIFLTFVIAVWIPLDILLWDRQSRFLLTHFFATIWALMGVSVRLVKFNNPDRTMLAYSDTLLCIIIVFFIARSILTLNRHKNTNFKIPEIV